MLTDEDRNYILNEHLMLIQHISDKEYQRRIWIRGEGPECSNFGDAVNNYSSDAEEILENYKKYKISEIQLSALKIFHAEFKKFWEDNDWPPLFIDTSEWTKITEMAKEVLIAFNWKNLSVNTAEHPDLNRNQIFEYFLRDIAGLSVKEPEQGVWLLAEGEEPDNFKETVSRYFNIADSILEEYKDYGISDAQLHILKKFHEAFSKFWKGNDLPHLLLHTTEWYNITELAKEVLKAFDYKKENAT